MLVASDHSFAVAPDAADAADLGPSADTMADGFIGALDGIADFLESHKGDIVDFFQKGYEYITGTLIPKLQELQKWLFGTPAETQDTTKIVTSPGGNDKIVKTGTEIINPAQ